MARKLFGIADGFGMRRGAVIFGTGGMFLLAYTSLLPEEREYLVNRSFMGRNGLTPDGYREITSGFPKSWHGRT